VSAGYERAQATHTRASRSRSWPGAPASLTVYREVDVAESPDAQPRQSAPKANDLCYPIGPFRRPESLSDAERRRAIDAIAATPPRMRAAVWAESFARTLHHPDMGVLRLDQMLAQYECHSAHHVAHVTRLRERMGW
jgi:hypothetical protein